MAHPPSGRSPHRARKRRSSLVVEGELPATAGRALALPPMMGHDVQGVPSGPAVGALSTAEGDRGQLERPNVAAEPLTVQREAARGGVRVSALAIRQDVDSQPLLGGRPDRRQQQALPWSHQPRDGER